MATTLPTASFGREGKGLGRGRGTRRGGGRGSKGWREWVGEEG